MKSLVISIILGLSLCSCSKSLYQVYNIVPTWENPKDKLIFENEDIKIGYNLWSDNGNSNFMIHNKTDQNIYVDLGLSHAIVNEVASTYFENASYTNKRQSTVKSSGIYGSSVFNETGSEKTIHQQRVVCIPPNAGKVITGFTISNSPYYSKTLRTNINGNGKVSEKFDAEKTPITINTIITYRNTEENNNNNKSVENRMWADEISNNGEKVFYKPISVKGDASIETLKKNNRFYIKLPKY